MPRALERTELASVPVSALERIADLLGMSVSTFFEDAPSDAFAQVADLVAAFVAIDDPGARQACLAYVRAEAALAHVARR